MGGLTDSDDIRMTNLDSSEEQFMKQVEEENDSDPMVSEDSEIKEDHDKVIGEAEEIESPTMPTSDIIPEIQIITPADNASLNSQNENVVDIDVNQESQISADTIDADESIISHEESTNGFGQNTQEVDDVVSVSSIETSEIVTNIIEAGIFTGQNNNFMIF